MDKKYYGLDKLRKWLISQDFNLYLDHEKGSGCNWYACRYSKLKARKCETNSHKKQMQLMVMPIDLANSNYKCVVVKIRGEANGVWWTIEVDSIHPDRLPNELKEIEKSIIAAWNALKEGGSVVI